MIPRTIILIRMTEEKDARGYLETMANKLTSDVDRIKSQYNRLHLQVHTYIHAYKCVYYRFAPLSPFLLLNACMV